MGTLLASIGLPLAVEAIKKITGKGAPRMGSDLIKGHGAPRLGMYQPPPFIGSWKQVRKGGGKKKAPIKTKKSGKGLLLGKNSPFKNVPLLNILL